MGTQPPHLFCNSPIFLLLKMGTYVFQLSIISILQALTWMRYHKILEKSPSAENMTIVEEKGTFRATDPSTSDPSTSILEGHVWASIEGERVL